jgi:hypothetical protein
MSRIPLPPALSTKLKDFLDGGKSGTIILQIRDGRVMAYEMHEKGAVKYDDPRDEERVILRG